MIVVPAPPAVAVTVGESVALATDAPTASSPAATPVTSAVARGVTLARTETSLTASIWLPLPVVAVIVGSMVAVPSAPSPETIPPEAAVESAVASSTPLRVDRHVVAAGQVDVRIRMGIGRAAVGGAWRC